jgi:hypothetical protein
MDPGTLLNRLTKFGFVELVPVETDVLEVLTSVDQHEANWPGQPTQFVVDELVVDHRKMKSSYFRGSSEFGPPKKP